jgi:hypothetical protein
MFFELPKIDRYSLYASSAGGAVTYSSLREMLGYYPFRSQG